MALKARCYFMNKPIVSIIMSTYNESENELQQSLNSILMQTYENIEFVIVNDNPKNKKLDKFLSAINDTRVKILKNEKNIGLVSSLNRALKEATGDIIVRADADDISRQDRIEKQLEYLNNKQLDIVGSYMKVIDENDLIINPSMRFPVDTEGINKFIKWGNCVPHPTWMVKREVYDKLNGYREVPSCEDYDLIVRALKNNYKINNIPEELVKYRSRSNSVSNSNATKQYILRWYISNHRKQEITMKNIENYISSEKFICNCRKYDLFIQNKSKVKEGAWFKIFELINNKYFWIMGCEKISIKLREKDW